MDRVEASVSAAYGLPAVVLSLLVGLKNSPWSQYSEARRSVYEDTIDPLWRMIGKTLTRQLLRPVDPDPRRHVMFDTSQVKALQPNTSQDIEDAKLASWWTVGERRAHTGREALGDDRDDVVELTDLALASPFGSSHEDDEGDVPKRLMTRERNPTQTKRDWAWSQWNMMAKAQESTWESRSSAELVTDREAVLDLFDEIFEESVKDGDLVGALLASLGRALDPERWKAAMLPLIRSTGITALREKSVQVGVDFNLLRPGLIAYTEAEAAFLVKGIDSTTRLALSDALAAGLRKGEGIPQLRKRIEESGAFSRSRARLIAITETTRVSNGAAQESLLAYSAESGVAFEKSWLSARDASVRPMHDKLDDGSYVPLDVPFDNGLMQPGEPNCRCTTLHRKAGA